MAGTREGEFEEKRRKESKSWSILCPRRRSLCLVQQSLIRNKREEMAKRTNIHGQSIVLGTRSVELMAVAQCNRFKYYKCTIIQLSGGGFYPQVCLSCLHTLAAAHSVRVWRLTLFADFQ